LIPDTDSGFFRAVDTRHGIRRSPEFSEKKRSPIWAYLTAWHLISLMGRVLIYNKCIHFIMSSTSVYSIRIDTRVRKMIEEMPDQNWQDEIRRLIEQSVKKKRKDYFLSRARENQHTLITGMPAAQAIREDRDAR